jgi:hypothetical protein
MERFGSVVIYYYYVVIYRLVYIHYDKTVFDVAYCL